MRTRKNKSKGIDESVVVNNSSATQTAAGLFALPHDTLLEIIGYLPFNGTVSLMRTCKQLHTLFKTDDVYNRKIRKEYIREFLTSDPRMINDLSELQAFRNLIQDFIIPFEAQYFKITQPSPLTGEYAHHEIICGKYKGKRAIDVCTELGFEKLYLQIFKSRSEENFKHDRHKPEYSQRVMADLYRVLYWDSHLDVIKNASDPLKFLWAMVSDVHPYLYFIALCATLNQGRVDLFAALIKELQARDDELSRDCYVSPHEDSIVLTKWSSHQNTYALTLENIRLWNVQFRNESDKFVIPNHAEWGKCESLFELCMAMLSQVDDKHPIHFLWSCYADDNAQILEYLNNLLTKIEAVYQPQDFHESAIAVQRRDAHLDVANMQESALSLYARNIHPENEAIIARLLANEFLRSLMHRRNEYRQTPLQIALKHGKTKFVNAMLAKTSEELLQTEYSSEEIAAIHQALAPVIVEEESPEDDKKNMCTLS